ncbi:MAG: HupE/UreJ family protein [Chromatiales bacterium]|nr:HupE/UreJ family protein [Chromatiales bacterium]
MIEKAMQGTSTGDASSVSRLAISVLALCALLPGLALGHVESSVVGDGGFVSGLVHPVTGLDHVVAMVAVGLWGAILGAPAIWVLPIAFPLIMTVGAVLGILDVPVPAIGLGIAASAIVLGGMVSANARPPLAIAFLSIAFFAIYHGHPHGAALPDFGVPILYAAGFVVATGLLHVAGIAFGLLYRWPAGETAVRAMGAGIAAVGGYFLLIAIGRGL